MVKQTNHTWTGKKFACTTRHE